MSESLIEQAQANGAPVIDSESATFVWEGKDPPQVIGDFNDWDTNHALLFKKTGRQWWSTTIQLPPDAYMEYTFIRHGERLRDPLNRCCTSNGMGKTNQFFYMPEARPTPFLAEPAGAPGLLTRHQVATDGLAVGKQRLVYLYQPPTQRPSSLLVVLDGREYMRRARLHIMVANLMAQKRIRPLAIAYVFNNPAARLVEYTCSEASLAFLSEKVLPLARQNLRLVDLAAQPEQCGILGASLGGLMALFAGLRLPQFGKVISQSGAFNAWDFESVVYPLARLVQPTYPQVWLSVGRYEDLLETNRLMFEVLKGQALQVSLNEYNAGHNYPAWRDQVDQGLVACFGKGK